MAGGGGKFGWPETVALVGVAAFGAVMLRGWPEGFAFGWDAVMGLSAAATAGAAWAAFHVARREWFSRALRDRQETAAVRLTFSEFIEFLADAERTLRQIGSPNLGGFMAADLSDLSEEVRAIETRLDGLSLDRLHLADSLCAVLAVDLRGRVREIRGLLDFLQEHPWHLDAAFARNLLIQSIHEHAGSARDVLRQLAGRMRAWKY